MNSSLKFFFTVSLISILTKPAFASSGNCLDKVYLTAFNDRVVDSLTSIEAVGDEIDSLTVNNFDRSIIEGREHQTIEYTLRLKQRSFLSSVIALRDPARLSLTVTLKVDSSCESAISAKQIAIDGHIYQDVAEDDRPGVAKANEEFKTKIKATGLRIDLGIMRLNLGNVHRSQSFSN